LLVTTTTTFFCLPEKIQDGSNGDKATDSYNKYKVKILIKILKTCFALYPSFAEGTLLGGVNPEGIKYYNNLIDELLKNGTNEKNGIPIGPLSMHFILLLVSMQNGSWVNVYPHGMKELLLYTKKRYNNPKIYITENGECRWRYVELKA
ncbi:hypothetical protein BHM03_00051472, partial [Ensete ventricosum]